MDAFLFSFISENWFSLTLALGVLKIVAKFTPWVIDDEIHTLLSGVFGMIRKPVPPSGIPSMEERGEEVK